MKSEMIKRSGRKVIRFCIKNACFILPYPDRGTRARLVKNSALFLYVLVLLTFQFYIYRLSPQILGFATNIATSDLYQLTNHERTSHGTTTLSRSAKLEKAAFKKAQDMFTKNYWAHYAPDGSTTPWQFISQTGYVYKYAGENLAKDFDTSASVVTAWIASPSHQANLLNPNYKDVGIVAVNGTLLGEETTLVVQMFASPVVTALASQPAGGAAGSEVEAQPRVVTGPTEEKKAAVSQPTALAEAKATPVTQIVRTLNPTASPKAVPLGFGFLLLGLFTLDEVSMLRGGLTKGEWRRTAENAAHIVILGLLMAVVWFAKTGGVL